MLNTRRLFVTAAALCGGVFSFGCPIDCNSARFGVRPVDETASVADKEPDLCVPAIDTSCGDDFAQIPNHIIECGYNFSTLDTKNLGTPYANSNSNPVPSETVPPVNNAPSAMYAPRGYSTPPATTNGVSAPTQNYGANVSSTNAPAAQPTPKSGGIRGALRSFKQGFQNNLQTDPTPMQNNSGTVYSPAPEDYGQPPAVPTALPGYAVPQMVPQGYGVSVHGGPRNGELGPDIDQDVMNRHYQELKRREATGGMSPVMGDIFKNSSPEMRAKLMQMYQQQHAVPLPTGQEPTTPEEMVKAGLYIEREKQYSKLPQAIEYFRKAAEAGFSPGMCLLADRYQTGVRDVLQADQKKAYYWWTKAAAKGERLALFAMGSYYLNGDQVPKNQTKAFQYFLQSAQKGFNTAKLAVGQAYVCGEGVAENRPQALKWLEEANNGGSPEAGSWLFMLKLKNCPSHFANRQAFLNYGYTADATWKANQAAGGNANNARIKAITTPYGSIEHTQAVNQYRNNTLIEERTRQQLNTQF